MAKLFTQIYFSIKKWRKAFFLLIIGMLSLFVYLASQINFEEDISKMLPKDEHNDITAKVINQLNFSDKITIMIRANDKEKQEELTRIAQQFIDSIAQDSTHYSEIQGIVDSKEIDETFTFVYEHLPLFLEEEDYQALEAEISKDKIEERMQENFSTLISPTGIVARDFILRDPLGITFKGLNHLRELGVSKDFIINNEYLHSADTSTLLLFITPSVSGTDTKRNEEFVKHLYAYQEAINKENEGIASITYFGAPFIALANATQIKRDIQSTVVISLSILMLILTFFYRKIYVPIILFIPAAIGASSALAFLYFTHDSISAISISIGAILIGITVDYPLHVITHFRENSDVKHLFKSVAKPIMASSLTTAAAFLCLIFVNSEVLNDLGIFASITIIVSALSALIIVPHLYIPKIVEKTTFIDRFADYKFEKNKIIIALISLASIVGIFAFSKVGFNNNIADLNFVPKDMKASEKQFENLGSVGGKSIYLSVYGTNNDSVIHKNNELEKQLQQLQKEGVINDYTSVGKFVLSEEKQLEKIQKWNKFWSSEKIENTTNWVEESAVDLGFNSGTFASLTGLLGEKHIPISITDYSRLEALQLGEFFTEKEGFYTLSSLVKTDSLHRLEAIQRLTQDNVIPIDRKNISEQFLGQIRDDFKQLMNYSLLAVFIILLFFFKRVELSLIAILPIILTGLVTATFIYLFNLELNVFSTIVTTLIIGLGVDFSIFMTSGLQKRYTTGEDELHTYRTSIILAVLTTVLAIGVLIFAKHPALKSVSAIALIGIVSAMLITFSLYPILFKFFIENRPRKGKSPVSLRLMVTAILSFGYFGGVSIFFSIVGFLIVPILPFKKEKKIYWFRRTISFFTKSVLYSNYGVKNKIVNPHHETFKEPAIIVANHSSFLDTLSLGFLPIPYIFLVNDWVYHSPVFGKAIQRAGYYPVSTGIESGEDKLIQDIKSGTFLAVFPEGTRSLDGAIARFRKGAFLLAQKYQIDVIPLYIHGNADLLPKGDFIIFDGHHYLEIGKRIKFDEATKEENLKDVTKRINTNFRNHFQKIRDEKEGVDYFKEKIKLNFLYKLPEITQQAKEEFETNKLIYHKMNDKFSGNESILRIGNDLGIWDLMLTFQQQRRQVYSFITNEYNRKVAKTSYLIQKRNLYYLEKPQEIKAKVLFITSTVEEEIVHELLNQQQFKKVIFLKNTFPIEIFNKFEYKIIEEDEDTDYYLLKP